MSSTPQTAELCNRVLNKHCVQDIEILGNLNVSHCDVDSGMAIVVPQGLSGSERPSPIGMVTAVCKKLIKQIHVFIFKFDTDKEMCCMKAKWKTKNNLDV